MQNLQFQQETRASIQRQEASIQNLTTQMGQMATSLNTLQSQNSDKLPAQTVVNPKNVSAISLRSGKQIEVPEPVSSSFDSSNLKKVTTPSDSTPSEPSTSTSSNPLAVQRQHSIPLPFPSKMLPIKRTEEVDK